MSLFDQAMIERRAQEAETRLIQKIAAGDEDEKEWNLPMGFEVSENMDIQGDKALANCYGMGKLSLYTGGFLVQWKDFYGVIEGNVLFFFKELGSTVYILPPLDLTVVVRIKKYTDNMGFSLYTAGNNTPVKLRCANKKDTERWLSGLRKCRQVIARDYSTGVLPYTCFEERTDAITEWRALALSAVDTLYPVAKRKGFFS